MGIPYISVRADAWAKTPVSAVRDVPAVSLRVTQTHRYSETQDIQGYTRKYMAFGDDDNSTYEQVTAWRDQLFENRSLRISVEELSKWPLGRYLWAAVFQAARLDGLRGADGTPVADTSVGLWALR